MSKVHFLRTDIQEFERNPKALVKFLNNTELFSSIKNKDLVGIKIHFGEDKNKSYIKPHYLKNLVEKLRRIGAKTLLFDTNTLYRGKRTNAVDHFNLAFFAHNFRILNTPVVIADGLKGNDYIEVEVKGKHFKKAKVASLLRDLDFMLVLSHLTGHMLSGFGASIKNLGMGCASRSGKMAQHCEISPQVNHGICIHCEKCIEICPQQAISLRGKKIFIDMGKCIGCAQCISECPKGAIKIVWSENCTLLQEKMVEYAKAAVNVCRNCFFVNFAMFVTKECDCMSQEKEGAVSDLGILASSDAVSIDKAGVDLISQENKKDVFLEFHPEVSYCQQFNYAQSIGLGQSDYKLIEVKV